MTTEDAVQKTRDVLRLRHLSLSTEDNYVSWLRRYARFVSERCDPLGLCITPHHLRHAYATHCLNRGANVKALQEALGHSQVQTTIGYCHAEACSVPSPLEALGEVKI